jgi:hypothetical protein
VNLLQRDAGPAFGSDGGRSWLGWTVRRCVRWVLGAPAAIEMSLFLTHRDVSFRSFKHPFVLNIPEMVWSFLKIYVATQH